MAPNPALGKLLRNMPEEVERFRRSRVPEDWPARYMIQEISKGTPAEVRLRNGRKVVKRIEDITQDGFTLDDGRQLVFEEVVSVQTFGPVQASNTPRLNKTGKILLAIGVAILVVVVLKKASESI
jgi:hypothetical protein